MKFTLHMEGGYSYTQPDVERASAEELSRLIKEEQSRWITVNESKSFRIASILAIELSE